MAVRILRRWAPIRDGEVWAVGPHRVLCADFREVGWTGRWDALADGFRAPDCVRTWPPPDQSAAARAQRHSGRGVSSVHYADLLVRLGDLVRERLPNGLVEVRLSPRALDVWQRIAERRGWSEIALEAVRSRNHRMPHVVWRGVSGAADPTLPATSVLDPCCGDGEYLVRAAQAGAVCMGIEIVPAKLSRALARLSVATGLDPVRIHPLPC